MPEVFNPRVLNYYTLSSVIRWIVCASSNPTLTHLPLSGSLDSLFCNLMAPTPDDSLASSGVIIFVRQGLSFSELSISPLSSLDPYSDYVRINIPLNNSSLLSFRNVCAFPIHSSIAESTSFPPPFFSSPESL